VQRWKPSSLEPWLPADDRMERVRPGGASERAAVGAAEDGHYRYAHRRGEAVTASSPGNGKEVAMHCR